MSQRLTLMCDGCGKEFIVDEAMDLPPYWLAVTINVADKDGLVPDQEKDDYLHFCSQECLVDFCAGEEVKDLLMLIDKVGGMRDEEKGLEEEND